MVSGVRSIDCGKFISDSLTGAETTDCRGRLVRVYADVFSATFFARGCGVKACYI